MVLTTTETFQILPIFSLKSSLPSPNQNAFDDRGTNKAGKWPQDLAPSSMMDGRF